MFKRFVLGAALSLAATPSMAASVLYGTDNATTYTVDTATGVVTVVGSLGVSGFDANGYGTIIRDMTASATTLYGAQWNVDANGITGAVATIDAYSGAVTGSVALTGLLETGFNKGLYSVAYDLSTNTLYGNTAQRLYRIDPLTGASTLVGGVTTGSIVGLAIDNITGALYSITQTGSQGAIVTTLRTLSKVNGSVLSSVTLANRCSCDLVFDPASGQGYISSAFYDANDAFLYAGLDALDSTNTNVAFVGQHGPAAPFGMTGLAFVNVAAIPEPATWSMMIAGFGLVGFAVRRSRRVTALA